MELTELNKLVKKRVRIILNCNPPISYTGILISFDEQFITIKDIKQDLVSINKSSVSQIIQQNNGGG